MQLQLAMSKCGLVNKSVVPRLRIRSHVQQRACVILILVELEHVAVNLYTVAVYLHTGTVHPLLPSLKTTCVLFEVFWLGKSMWV